MLSWNANLECSNRYLIQQGSMLTLNWEFVLDIGYQVWGQDTQTKSSRLVILTLFENFIFQDNKNFMLLVNHSLYLLKHHIWNQINNLL